MRLGLLIPQGDFNEFDGWEPSAAWDRAGQNLQPRPEMIADAVAVGFDRFVAGVPGLANTFETLDEFLEEAAAAGVHLAPLTASPQERVATR